MSSKSTNASAPSATETLAATAKTLESLAAFALDTAKKLGADAAKINTGAASQKRLVVEAGEFTLANSLDSRSLSIVVHKDKKKGSASINTATEESVRRAVEAALALAKYSVPDEFITLATRDEAPSAQALPFIYEEALAETDLTAIQGIMQEGLARVTSDKRVALDRYEMSVDVSYHGLATSVGVHQHEKQTQASWSYFGMARDGDEVTGFDYDGSFSYTKAHMLPRTLADAEKFAAKVLGGLKPIKCPSYKGPILLSPRAVQELLLGMILFHASGRSVMDGKSRWEKDVGKRVVSSKFSLRDLPHDARFSGTTSFDGDGIPTRAMSIVDQGVLKLHLHDCYSAKRCHTKTTASAGGPFACEIAAGSTPLAQMLTGNKHLLLVDRFSGNSDPIKGDFSGVAKSSRYYENGADKGGVTETMIAGNFFDLAEQLLAVGDKAELIGGSFASPYILVDAVSVTGG